MLTLIAHWDVFGGTPLALALALAILPGVHTQAVKHSIHTTSARTQQKYLMSLKIKDASETKIIIFSTIIP